VTDTNATDDIFAFRAVAPPPPPSADLSISIVASPSTVMAGDTLTYTITVTNNGPDAASALSLRDVLPDPANFVSATLSQGTFDQSEGIMICLLGSLPSGASATLVIVVAPSAAGTVSDSAEVSASEADPFPANNSASETTTV